jgi:hypothetical protein
MVGKNLPLFFTKVLQFTKGKQFHPIIHHNSTVLATPRYIATDAMAMAPREQGDIRANLQSHAAFHSLPEEISGNIPVTCAAAMWRPPDGSSSNP